MSLGVTASLWFLLSAQAGASDRPGEVPQRCLEEAEDTDVLTEDGAAIHLHRHPSEGPPVLLVHGISANHWFMDLGPDRSLAWHLQEAGFDAWTLDLRGHGDARRTESTGRQVAGWTIEDYGKHDLHAAIEHIKEVRGVDRVGYVGHSLGGMVSAIYQAERGDDFLAAVVVVGSPIDFTHPDPMVGMARVALVLGTAPRRLPGPMVGDTAAALGGAGPVTDMIWAPDSMDKLNERRMMARVVGNFSSRELAHLKRMLAAGALVSEDGETNYNAALSTFSRPLLVIAGRGDQVAPPDRVRPWLDLVDSETAEFVVAGRANGFSFDHGHADLLLGDTAPEEIYPLISDFLEAQMTPDPPDDAD